MIIQFEQDINESQKEAIINRIKGLKYKPTEVNPKGNVPDWYWQEEFRYPIHWFNGWN